MTVSRLRVVGGIVTSVFVLLPALMAKGGPTIQLSVDASEAPRKIFHARLKIPATAGTLTLYYPKWIPGEHAPDGPVTNLAGLKFFANGQELKSRRDALDGWTINVQVLSGQNAVKSPLGFLSPPPFDGG